MEKRIMIGIPVNRLLSPKFSISLAKITHYLIVSGWTVEINFDNGSVLSSQRNAIIHAAFKSQMSLLFVDSDMIFEADVLESILIESSTNEMNIVGGLCFMRRYPFKPVVFSEDLAETEGVFKGMPYGNIPSYPFKCAGVGCSFLYIPYPAIKLILENNKVPFNHHSMPNGDTLGEDLSFMHCCNMIEGIDIICVPGVEIGHMTDRIVTRSDHVAATVEIEKANQETMCGKLK
jgi:hypothetical protein